MLLSLSLNGGRHATEFLPPYVCNLLSCATGVKLWDHKQLFDKRARI